MVRTSYKSVDSVQVSTECTAQLSAVFSSALSLDTAGHFKYSTQLLPE
jgi:hypothetical protein